MRPRKTFDERAAELRAKLTGQKWVDPEEDALIERISQRAARIVLDAIEGESVWVNIKEAAAHLSLTESAIRQRKCAGQFPDECFKKIGGSVRCDLRALDRLGIKKGESPEPGLNQRHPVYKTGA